MKWTISKKLSHLNPGGVSEKTYGICTTSGKSQTSPGDSLSRLITPNKAGQGDSVLQTYNQGHGLLVWTGIWPSLPSHFQEQGGQ